jgi:predicted acetyltransferase
MLSASDFDAMAHIFAEAYPGLGILTDEGRDRFKTRALEIHEAEPTAHFYGLFRGGQVLGIMCLYDFRMNFLQARIPAGGVGQVAVALLHKKEHVAKEMMVYSLQHYRAQDVPLVALYPFRPDFYRKMGFGYGTKMNQYRVKPEALPGGRARRRVRYLDAADRQALLDCYQRAVDRTHGMMDKTGRELDRLFANQQHRIAGYERDGRLEGYLVFAFEAGETWLQNDIQVEELIYDGREALSALLGFLHVQADQIRHIILNTQDEYLHHLLLDPRNGSDRLIPDVYHETNTQGVGLMYRVIDVPGMFERLAGRDFGGQSCTLKLTVEDSLLSENAGSTLLRFERGYVQRLDNGPGEAAHDVEMRLDIADFSSLLAGTVDVTSLHRYGLADLSAPVYIGTLNRLFAVEQKPVCTTGF